MKTVFRKAVVPKEIRALVAFDRKIFPSADCFEPDYWRACESFWLIAGNTKVGCCAFEKDAGRTGWLYIGTTGILPKFQHQGFGAVMKAWQIAYARYHGYKRIVTHCRESNERIIALNRQYGFRVARTVPNYYSEPAESAVLMELRLKHAT